MKGSKQESAISIPIAEVLMLVQVCTAAGIVYVMVFQFPSLDRIPMVAVDITTSGIRFISPAETGMCPITDLRYTTANAEQVLPAHNGMKIPVIKTVRKVTLLDKEYLVESF